MVVLSVAWVLMIWVFSLCLDPGESFHLAHYFWLLVAVGIVVWRERKKCEKKKVIGNLLNNNSKERSMR